MIRKTIALFALVWSSVSCGRPDEPMHSSYGTLTEFLAQENLYQKLAIEKVNVDQLAIVDSKDYRPDNKHMHRRSLEATYDFSVTARNSVYQTKAAIVSKDSINWQMKSLVLRGKADSVNAVTEITYTWAVDKNVIRRTSATKRMESGI